MHNATYLIYKPIKTRRLGQGEKSLKECASQNIAMAKESTLKYSELIIELISVESASTLRAE